MTDVSGKYYELLGVAPGASARELKEAYRDLAKVWHPDRFSHDPRLQQKAQEKLKEINEAYERLTSGKAAGRAHNPAPPREPHAPTAAAVRRRRRRVIVPTAVVFSAAFFAALSTLVTPDARRASQPTPPAEREESRPAEDVQRPAAAAAPPAPQSTRGKGRTANQPPVEESSGGSHGPGHETTQMRPMPTVTVTIDAVTGLLATRDCPTVSRMTYPAGGQPQQYCATPHKTKVTAQPDPARQKDSRLKSVGKVLAAPAKWLGGRKATGDAEARDARPPGGSGGQNR